MKYFKTTNLTLFFKARVKIKINIYTSIKTIEYNQLLRVKY